MINTFTFLTLLLLFVRIYSLVSILFLSGKRVQFAERITVSILLFEVLTIFLYAFFSSFRYLLPPVLMLLKTQKIFILKAFFYFYHYLLHLLFLRNFYLTKLPIDKDIYNPTRLDHFIVIQARHISCLKL